MTLEAARSKAASSTGPTPAFSCWRMNSSSLSVLIASDNVNIRPYTKKSPSMKLGDFAEPR